MRNYNEIIKEISVKVENYIEEVLEEAFEKSVEELKKQRYEYQEEYFISYNTNLEFELDSFDEITNTIALSNFNTLEYLDKLAGLNLTAEEKKVLEDNEFDMKDIRVKDFYREYKERIKEITLN